MVISWIQKHNLAKRHHVLYAVALDGDATFLHPYGGASWHPCYLLPFCVDAVGLLTTIQTKLQIFPYLLQSSTYRQTCKIQNVKICLYLNINQLEESSQDQKVSLISCV